MLRSTLCSSTATASYRNALLPHLRPIPLVRPCVHSGARLIGTSSINRDSLTSRTAQAESTTPHIKDIRVQTPQPDSANQTPPTLVRGDWVLFHPVYTQEELRSVEVLHRETTRWSDKVAYGMVRLARKMFDLVSGYKHKPIPENTTMSIEELRKQGYILGPHQWLNRILFLETIAGVPGMVAATLRHLTSLRLMRRDSGWIHTCLEEAENERMHLMTFMTLRKPSIFFRAVVLGAQGVFYNLFFLAYMISPRICHRFVGYLEEEAVRTYTVCIQDMEAGRIPEWADEPAPEIAIDYWRLAPDAKLLDVIYAVRSDESTHRFVNHSMANLNPATDVNPFALREPDMHTKGSKIAFDRKEAEQFVQESHALMGKGSEAANLSQKPEA